MTNEQEVLPLTIKPEDEIRRLKDLVAFLAQPSAAHLRLEVVAELADPADEQKGARWSLCVTAPGMNEEQIAKAAMPLLMAFLRCAK